MIHNCLEYLNNYMLTLQQQVKVNLGKNFHGTLLIQF